MKKVISYFNKKDIFVMLISLCLIIGQVWLEITMPTYMENITYLLNTSGSIAQILENGAYMLACSLGSLGLSIIVGFLTARLAAGLSLRLRNAIYGQVSTFSKQEIRKFSTASLVTRCTNDVTQVQMLLAMGLQVLIKAPVLSIWAICTIIGKSWQWTAITAAAVAFLLVFVTIIIICCLPRFKIIQKQTDDLNRVTRESLTGMRIVHAFNAEEYQQEKFQKVNTSLYKTHLFTTTTLSFMSPIMQTLTGGLSLAIYWVGAYIIQNANVAMKYDLFSDMVTFMTYSMMIISSFIMLIFVFIQLPRAIVSMRRIEEVISTESSVKSGNGVVPKESGTIEFRNVNFKYPDGKEMVLSDINLKIEKGETVAFIGSTGSGKTTLVDLVPRFYDVTSGEVLVDGENVKDFKLKSLHEKVGYVSQKAMLLSGTVFDNISMGKDIELQDVLKALEQAQAKDFVDKMENKHEAKIYQGGKNISGGQKQRLSIARAIAKKPEFIIFDDSFSALDYKTDRKLRTALEKELSDTTCLIVAQRIGTIKNADKIVVLDNGKIVGVGKHDELLKDCKVYKEIALSQLDKEEL